MKKIFLLTLALLLPNLAQAKLKVVATLPVFAALAEEVGGDRVEITPLARGNQDPHFLDAKPTFAAALNQADALIHGGLDLEIGWLPPILIQARNGKVQPNSPGDINLAQGISILEIPNTPIDRSMGDVHPRGNPHTWLDPRNARIMAANLFQHLANLDPEGKSYYENRLKNFLTRLDGKLAEWKTQTAAFQGKKIITYHKSFSYFAAWTGLEVARNIEPKPGLPPSSKHIDELLQMIPAEGVQAIVVESFYSKKVPEYLAEKSGRPYLMLPTDTGELGVKTYLELIDYLVSQMGKVI